mmetsp:Transcript_6462/g.25047  ORF Transcript_6462/g.25047 Transcript_6462/m.25047 type:complete len:229 (-) Transcript_6462:773-1459(-)
MAPPCLAVSKAPRSARCCSRGPAGSSRRSSSRPKLTSSAYTRRIKAPSCIDDAPATSAGVAAATATTDGDGGTGGCGPPVCGDAAAAAAAALAAAAAADAAAGEDACAHLSSKAASPLARSSDGRAAHTAPRDPGGEPGSATPVASARIATQTYSKHSSGSVTVAPMKRLPSLRPLRLAEFVAPNGRRGDDARAIGPGSIAPRLPTPSPAAAASAALAAAASGSAASP